MDGLRHSTKLAFRVAMFAVLASFLSGCYIFNFFKRDSGSDDSDGGSTGVVLGRTLGTTAGGIDEAALAEVYAVTSPHVPAAIRPDPDLYVRRLLRQYRSEGATIARQIGLVENYRMLLGGASEDFSKTPQEEYDATSLLAVLKVAEEVCRGLVAPNQYEHPGWSTILPHPAGSERDNTEWLAQRMIGRPSQDIDTSKIDALLDILDAERNFISQEWWAYNNPYVIYIPVCAALALDAEALYL